MKERGGMGWRVPRGECLTRQDGNGRQGGFRKGAKPQSTTKGF